METGSWQWSNIGALLADLLKAFDCLPHELSIVNLHGYGIPGLWTQELNAELWMLDSGRWALDAEFWMLDTGLWMLDSVPLTLLQNRIRTQSLILLD